jgi:hypothetical protein
MKQPGGNVTGFSLFEFSLGGKCTPRNSVGWPSSVR